MKYLSLILLFVLRLSFAFGSDKGIGFHISDTVRVEVKNRRVEAIEIRVLLRNNTDGAVLLNKQTGITELGSITGHFISDYCDKLDYQGSYRMFVFDNNGMSLDDYSSFSIGDYVYFDKKGNLKYVYLEGVDNPDKIKRKHKKANKHRSHPSIVMLKPKQEVSFIAKIYLGNYLFSKNETYHLLLVYNQKSEVELSKVCFESNRLVLLTK